MAKKKTPAKRNPTKRSGSKKPKKKGVRTQIIEKIPSKYKIKGGKSKYKSKQGSVETSYEDLEVGN